MDTIFSEWANFLFDESPKLLNQLDTLIDTTNESSIYSGTFFTLLQRNPDYIQGYTNRFMNKHANRNTYRLINRYDDDSVNYSSYYDTNDMFHFVVLTRDMKHQFIFNIRCHEFLEPTAIDKITNQLNSKYVPLTLRNIVNEELANKLRNIVWNWLHTCINIKICKQRMNIIKEELMAAAWKPERIEKWLEAGVDIESL